MKRTLYVSPRKRAVFSVQDEEGDEKNEEMDVDWKKHVLPELHEARQRSNITKVSINGELVKRQYHFDVPDVPQGTSEFIELIYGYDQPAFDAKVLSGMQK